MYLKAIVFDFDYTLADSSKGIIQSAKYALRKLGYESVLDEDIKKTIGLSLNDTYYQLTGDNDFNNGERFEKLFIYMADRVITDSTVFFPGVLETLEKIKKKGIKIGIVTTKYRYRIEQILKRHLKESLVDHIIGYEDVKKPKPDPEGLNRMIEIMKVDKDEVLYVGDSIVDQKAANNAKIRFIATTSGKTIESEFEDYPKYQIVDDINEILNIIKYIKGGE